MRDTLKFCAKCGKEAAPQAEYCQYCGTPIQLQPTRRKNKNTAVMLAISLSWWAWLYTYKKDRWKLWSGTGLGAISSGVIGVYILKQFEDAISLVDQAMAGVVSETPLAGSASEWSAWATIASVVIFGVWVWSIADTAMKRSEWYNTYYGDE